MPIGADRGGIDERWFSSTTKADNGPLTTPDEGLSYVVWEHDGQAEKVLLVDAVAELGAELLGDTLWNEYHALADLLQVLRQQGPAAPSPAPEAGACQAGRHGAQARGLLLPAADEQLRRRLPLHLLRAWSRARRREQVRHCLEIWNQGDNHITDLSQGLSPGAGHRLVRPGGLLHAPGSLCTYEPQWASDVFAMFQSLVTEVPIGWELLVKNVPADKQHDLDYLLDCWTGTPTSTPTSRTPTSGRRCRVKPIAEMRDAGYVENWITYGNQYFAAKELTVLPGRTVTIRDAGPYGFIMVQGHGTLGKHPIETPALIRFGQLTHDEYFVSAKAAQAGVTIHNPSTSDPIVMLKHFGPTPEAPR